MRSIAEQKLVILDTINHEIDRKLVREAQIKHMLKRERDLEMETHTRENRRLAQIKHEEDGIENKLARTKLAEDRLDFLKASLKII